MRFRSTGILGILFIALVAFVYFYEIQGGAERERQERAAKRLMSLDPASVTRIEVEKNDTLLVMEKSGEDWRILQPVEAEGYGPTIQLMASSVEEFESEGVAASGESLASGKVNLSDFGLEPASLRASITHAAGTDTFWFGSESPTGAYIYARWSGSQDVLMANKRRRTAFAKKLFDVREKLAFPTEMDAARRLRLEGNAVVELEREGGVWKLTQPVADLADQAEVDRLLNRLRTARARSFESETGDNLERFGLTEPLLKVIVYEGEDLAQKTFLVGDPIRKKNGLHYYVKYDAKPHVMTLDSLLVSNLQKTASDLRDKDIFTFSALADEVDGIRLAFRDSVVVARRPAEGGDWILENSSTERIVEATASRLIYEARELKAQAFVAESSDDPSAFGLDPAYATLTLTAEDRTLREIVLGKVGDDVFAVRDGRPQVVRIRSDFLANLDLGRIAVGPEPVAAEGPTSTDSD